MTTFKEPLENRFEAKLRDMARRLATTEQQLANLTSGPIAVTSTTHPASPYSGMLIYETDTGLTAMWTGTTWEYPPQLIYKTVLAATTASIPVTIPAAGFSTLRVVWSASCNDATSASYLTLQLNGDTGTNYLYEYNQINTATPGGGNSGGVTDRIRVGTMPASAATSGYFGSGEFVIAAASGSTYKAVNGRSTSVTSTTAGFSGTYGGLWLNTAAITSLTLLSPSGSLLAGTSISVYGG